MRRALEHLPAAVRAHGHVGVQDPCSWSLGGRGDRLGGRCHDRRSGCCGPRLQQGRLSAARGRIPVHTEVYFPFLDEAAEFPSVVLDALRQPLESGSITIHRSGVSATFPARFQLVLATNPCPCGNAGVRGAECTCPPQAVRRYLRRLSGPLLDRIDIELPLTRVTVATADERTSTAEARGRVLAARARAGARLRGTPWRTNADVSGQWLRSGPGRMPRGVADPLDRALLRGSLTLRGYDRALRIAWTLADLGGRDAPSAEDIGRALTLKRGIVA